MIIVSQDKKAIVNFKKINWLQVEERSIIYNYGKDYWNKLGDYKTEERAKEVLQEIVKAMVENKTAKEANEFFGFPTMYSNTYYQMPEE